MELRWYQAEAIESVYRFLRDRPGENPCIVLPTGAGKTPVLANICNDAVTRWGGRVLVLSHVKELVEQSAKTLNRWFPKLDVGVYSAGVGRREKRNAVVVAGIQSVWGKSLDLCGDTPFNLVVVDEAHRIPLTDDTGMYRHFFKELGVANPNFRVIGLTATNYRTDGGYVTGEDYVLNDVCYEASVRQLIAQGFLSKLTSKQGEHVADLSKARVVRGDFLEKDVERAFEGIVDSAIDEVIVQSQDRKSVLLFCASMIHMESVVEKVRERGYECYGVSGHTSNADRDELVGLFKSGRLKFLANINVFCEGFDAPNVDMVALLRATVSPGLYYQMVGRGLRICEGKQDCRVLDFGGNIERHGPIDAMVVNNKKPGTKGEPITKACPKCQEVVPIAASVCFDCGYEFPEPEKKERHEPEASSAAILSADEPSVEFLVEGATYFVHHKKNDPESTPSMRATYWCGDFPVADEWICFEHQGFARDKAVKWWQERSQHPVPESVEDAVQIARRGGLAETSKIVVKPQPGTRFKRIVSYELGEVPEPVNVDDENWDEVPF
jgi:DNA repair protein RadD